MNHLSKPVLAELNTSSISIATPPPGPRAQAIIARTRQYASPSLIHAYPLVVARGSGCMVEDVDGNVYLDCEAGVATVSTGHCHPRVIEATQRQALQLIHMCGTDFYYPSYTDLCARLAHLPGDGRDWQVFLTNSGAEGVEAAIKLARYSSRRTNLIAFQGSFHGRTLGALSLTGSRTKYRRGFGPLVPGVHLVPYGNTDAIENELFQHVVSPDEVAAIIVEPILGEGGYLLPPPPFLPRLREICDRDGIMLIFDEVQTGIGRTGTMLAAHHSGVSPDAFVLAKGLASGFPLGALVARKERMVWPAGSHGSTLGGNPVSIAAANATLDLVEGGLAENARIVGTWLRDTLAKAMATSPAVEEVRGLGMMIGVEFQTPEQSSAVTRVCFERGLLLLDCGRKTVRFCPPLLLSQEQADTAVKIFAGVVRDVAKTA